MLKKELAMTVFFNYRIKKFRNQKFLFTWTFTNNQKNIGIGINCNFRQILSSFNSNLKNYQFLKLKMHGKNLFLCCFYNSFTTVNWYIQLKIKYKNRITDQKGDAPWDKNSSRIHVHTVFIPRPHIKPTVHIIHQHTYALHRIPTIGTITLNKPFISDVNESSSETKNLEHFY